MQYFASLASALAVAGATPVKRSNPLAYISPTFSSQYANATAAGLIRGPYHFARPDLSSAAAEATNFLNNGGRWSPDGITLPGALDIEYNPDGAQCYNFTASEMVSWIQDFSDTYKAATSRYPVIYTTTNWWNNCTGNSVAFADSNPLWIADWSSTLGPLPAGWKDTSFWQYADSSKNPGDADLWNGDYTSLERFQRVHVAVPATSGGCITMVVLRLNIN
ncbi:hypothetical protein OG21DRAFT_1602283 [Imleria badia]|nr:hypothetical protein OG21DRAFT_1602283 [Imleria badia]